MKMFSLTLHEITRTKFSYWVQIQIYFYTRGHSTLINLRKELCNASYESECFFSFFEMQNAEVIKSQSWQSSARVRLNKRWISLTSQWHDLDQQTADRKKMNCVLGSRSWWPGRPQGRSQAASAPARWGRRRTPTRGPGTGTCGPRAVYTLQFALSGTGVASHTRIWNQIHSKIATFLHN